MAKNYYVSGQHNFHCDVCGRKLKSGEGRKRWDGFYVCSEDWEMRHPQDFIRTKPEKIAVEWSRKQPDVFITITYSCTSDGVTGIAGLAVVGCSVVGDM